MNLWIIITITAAFVQNLRSAMQKHLKGVMGTTGATFVRFGFGVPFAFFYWAILFTLTGSIMPSVSCAFFFWASIGALAQIGATFLLIYLFSFRNFTVGSAYSRTEPAQTAVFALIFFGEVLSGGAIIAICISITGVMLISVARSEITLKSLFLSILSRTSLIGLASGTLFGLSSVSYRAGILSVDHPFFMMQAATTLCYAILTQAILMFVWMTLRDRQELTKIAKAWKAGLLVGFFGATASFGWFSAFAIQHAALVKVVAQVEMIFTYCASVFFFKEKINRWEILGCVLITFGIITLLLIG